MIDTNMDLPRIAEDVVEQARKRNITLRLLGGIAFKLHSQKYWNVLENMGRQINDIDSIGYRKQIVEVKRLFIDLGYLLEWGAFADRMIFKNATGKYEVDVFFDKLEMCHEINLKGRLEIDSPTISVSDLLLMKIQIVKINEKDIKDLIILLLEHDVAREDKETINVEYISNLLSKDWGFYYTAKTNFDLVKRMLRNYGALTEDDRSTIETRIDRLIEAIDSQPKSLSWNLRAKVGTRKKWYEDVEDVWR